MSLNKTKKILILSPRFPFPTHKGDQLVIYNSIKYLSKKYQIDLLSFYDEEIEKNNYKKVEQYCNEIILVKHNKLNMYYQVFKSLFSNTPLQVGYFISKQYKSKLCYLLEKNNYDLLFPFTLRISKYVEDIDNKKYIHLIDSMNLNMERRAKNEKGLKKFIFHYESKKVSKYEKELIKKYEKSFLVSKIDKNYIDNKNKSINIFPNGVEVYNCEKNYETNKELLIIFTGNMGYFPNLNAVMWFIENCWDKISKSIPNSIFRIIGKNPSKKLKELASTYNNIEVVGFVDSIEEELCKADISVTPMQSGSGMQNKILEAMATKTPVITSSLGLGDIKAEVDKDILVANNSQEFLEKIKYLNNAKNKRFIGENGFKYVLEKHSWENIILSKISI